MTTLDQRSAELYEQIVSNLVNIGFSTEHAIDFLLMQSSIRMPHGAAVRKLQQVDAVIEQQAEDAPPLPWTEIN